MKATVTGVYVGDQTGTLVSTPLDQINLTWEGVQGDSHAGMMRKSDARDTKHYPRGTLMRNYRQVSLVAAEELATVATSMGLPNIRAEWLGANICIEGIPDFTLLPASTRLVFESGVVLLVSNENLPCIGPGKAIESHYPERAGIASQFPKAGMHKRGVVATVEQTGIVRVGESVRVILLKDYLR